MTLFFQPFFDIRVVNRFTPYYFLKPRLQFNGTMHNIQYVRIRMTSILIQLFFSVSQAVNRYFCLSLILASTCFYGYIYLLAYPCPCLSFSVSVYASISLSFVKGMQREMKPIVSEGGGECQFKLITSQCFSGNSSVVGKRTRRVFCSFENEQRFKQKLEEGIKTEEILLKEDPNN